MGGGELLVTYWLDAQKLGLAADYRGECGNDSGANGERRILQRDVLLVWHEYDAVGAQYADRRTSMSRSTTMRIGGPSHGNVRSQLRNNRCPPSTPTGLVHEPYEADGGAGRKRRLQPVEEDGRSGSRRI